MLESTVFGNTIATQGANLFDFKSPELSPIELDDIAHALANICRFGGHCSHFYSVAQHSVIVSFLVERALGMVALWHDAPEAYTGDIPKPLKIMLPDFCAIEDSVERAVFKAIGLPHPMPKEIKEADKSCYGAEMRDLMPVIPRLRNKSMIQNVMPQKIYPMRPVQARALFKERYYQLRTNYSEFDYSTYSKAFNPSYFQRFLNWAFFSEALC